MAAVTHESMPPDTRHTATSRDEGGRRKAEGEAFGSKPDSSLNSARSIVSSSGSSNAFSSYPPIRENAERGTMKDELKQNAFSSVSRSSFLLHRLLSDSVNVRAPDHFVELHLHANFFEAARGDERGQLLQVGLTP